MQKDVWLEVAINGAAGRGFQPLIPITIDDIVSESVECARSSASVVHIHVYDDSGQPSEDVELYRRAIEGIKEQVDIIAVSYTHLTLPTTPYV